MRKKGTKNDKKKMKFHQKKGPKTGTTQEQLRGQKTGKKKMENSLSRAPLPWGPRGYYEGKPSFRKTTALRKNKTKTNEGPELKGKSALEERTKNPESQHAPAEPGAPGPERTFVQPGPPGRPARD